LFAKVPDARPVQLFVAAIETDDCKRRLRANTDELIARGGFGSPTMFVDDSMFFGNDRLPLARAGKVRVLAVTSLTRSKVLPEVPTLAQTLPGLELIGWYGVVAPKRTPDAIVRRLERLT